MTGSFAKKGCIAVLLALIAQPALARGTQTAFNGMAISGSAADTCTLAAPTLVATSNASVSSATSSASTIAIANFVNPTDATYQPGISITLNFDGMCNYASKFRAQTLGGALKNTTTRAVSGSGPFFTQLNYLALMLWGNQVSVLNTTGTAGDKGTLGSVAGAYKGTASLSITLITPGAASTPLVSGAYTDQLTVQIGAAL